MCIGWLLNFTLNVNTNKQFVSELYNKQFAD